MEAKELIFKEIENVPETYLIEILDFIRFLETKALEQKRTQFQEPSPSKAFRAFQKGACVSEKNITNKAICKHKKN